MLNDSLVICNICLQLVTFYFNQSTFVAAEDDGYVLVNLTFGSELLCDSKVQFRYEDLTATGKFCDIHTYSYVLKVMCLSYVVSYTVISCVCLCIQNHNTPYS